MKALFLLVGAMLFLFSQSYAADTANETFLSEDEVTLERLSEELPTVRGGGAAGRATRPLPKVNILLIFAPNSTTLSEKGLKAVGVLKEAMEDTWAQYDFVVEGHADPIGNSRANEILSRKRAEKVKDTLVQLGVSPERLNAVGKGDKELVNTKDPRDPRNRRVVFQPKFPIQ